MWTFLCLCSSQFCPVELRQLDNSGAYLDIANSVLIVLLLIFYFTCRIVNDVCYPPVIDSVEVYTLWFLRDNSCKR